MVMSAIGPSRHLPPAAIWSLSTVKRPLRGHRRSFARDPTATLAARLRSGSPLAKKLLAEERAHAAVNVGDNNDAIFFHFTGLKDAP
jgi:hypothetical protein